MANFFKDNDDLRFYIERGIDWQAIVEMTEDELDPEVHFGSVDEAQAFYHDVLEMIGKFNAEVIAPQAAAIDHEGVELVDGEVVAPEAYNAIFRQLAELGIHGMCVPRELGGLNCPAILYMISCELFSRADASIMTHHGFHGGIAMALLMYAIEEGSAEFDPDTGALVATPFDEAIAELISGEANGCMVITEPDAGSDMSAMRTVGTLGEDGVWRISGNKIFITSGHGKYHIVIAKTEDDDDSAGGLRALSTFLVEAFQDDEDGVRQRHVVVDRLEEKLGHHASATCSVVYDESPARLIGRRGDGFKHMLLLMNNARIGVGFEAIGLCEAALALSRAYAEERRAFGKPIAQHELIAERLERMETDIVGMRALAMDAAFHEEMSLKANLRLKRASTPELERRRLESIKRKHQRASRRATPLLKFLAAERAVEMARECMQIHGGMGYTTEYGAEKLMRDALVMPIYEGTTQIQALMAMKDTFTRIIRNPQAFMRRRAQARWRSLSSREPAERRLAKVQSLSLAAQQHLLTRTAIDKMRGVQDRPMTEWLDVLRQDWDPKRDFAHAMLHAERLSQILVDELICELLYKQGCQHADRMVHFERYIEQAEPRCRYLYELITTTGDRLIEALHGPREQTTSEEFEAAGE